MDFHARQYDPQLGRFLSIDPLAYSGGQQVFSPYAAMGNSPGMMVDPNGEMTKYADLVQDGDYAVHGGMDAVAVRAFMANGAHMMYGRFFMLGMNTILTAAGGGGGNSMVGGPVTGRGNINRLMSIVKMIDLASRSGMLKNSNVIDLIAGLYNSGYDPRDGSDYYFSDNNTGNGERTQLHNTILITFSTTMDVSRYGTRLGAEMKLVYIGDISGYDKVEWVQNVTTNSPKDGISGKSYIDVGGSDENKRYPFYLPKDVLHIAEERGKHYGGIWYEDGPGRIVGQYFNREVYWMAETSLIGYKNGLWHHITTYSWGFSIKKGNDVILTPVNQISTPSYFNRQIIQSLNDK